MVNPTHNKNKSLSQLKVKRGKKYQKKREHENHELQIKIAKHIIRNGIQSPFDIKNDFKISNVLANKTVRSMLNNNYIQCVKETKISGGRRKYYNFKQNGIDWILENGNISFEDFWNLLFLIYDEKYDLKKFDPIEITIQKFEKSKQINRKYFFLYEHFAELANIGKLVMNEKMINNTGNRKKMFYNTVKPIFQRIILNKKPIIDDDILHELDFRYIINTSHNGKTKTHHLTPFGDMLLLYCFYDMTANMEQIDFTSIKENLTRKYNMVFSNWDMIKKITNWSDRSLINCFLNLHIRGPNKIFEQHKNSMKLYADIGFDDDVELLRMFYFIQNRMKFQFKKEFDSATKVIHNWAQKEQCLRILFNYDKLPSKYIKILALIGDQRFSKKQMKEILIESVKFNQSLLHDDWLHEKFGKKLKKDKLKRTKEEEEFLNACRNEPKPNTKTITKVLNVIKPITKYAELYNFMVPRDPELYLGQTTSKFFSNKIYSSLYNIISFQFFLILKLGTHPKKWEELMSRKEMKTVKTWFDDWIRIIADFYSDIVNNVREHKSDYSEYWNMQNPVFLEGPLMYKENLLPDDPDIKDAF